MAEQSPSEYQIVSAFNRTTRPEERRGVSEEQLADIGYESVEETAEAIQRAKAAQAAGKKVLRHLGGGIGGRSQYSYFKNPGPIRGESETDGGKIPDGHQDYNPHVITDEYREMAREHLSTAREMLENAQKLTPED